MTRVDPARLRLERRVAEFVARLAVLRAGEHALLMLSGGADSMALLSLLPRVDRRLGLGLELGAMHVDYRTRGAASDRDREIVDRACKAVGVPLHVVRLQRRMSGPGFQARARELRYSRARELAAEYGYDVIVTAHNRDDLAETILYRLVKYASPRGLVGMRPRERELARPLLGLGAGEIRDYCRACRIEYGEDETNSSPVYARNLLRLEVLPRLVELNPRLAETLAASSLQATAETEILGEAVADARGRVCREGPAVRGSAVIDAGRAPDACPAIDLAAFAAEPPALRALLLHDVAREALGGEALVERRVVDAMLRLAERGDDAGRVSLGRGLEAVRARGLLRIQARAPRHVCAPVRVTGAELEAAGGEGVALAPCGLALRARLLAGAHLDREAALTGAAFVGLDRAPGLVMVRHPRRGERFEPYGLGHETTVARYLAGARAPAASRARAIVLEVDGVCAWVGYSGADGRTVGRVAQAYRVAHSSVRTLHVVREGT